MNTLADQLEHDRLDLDVTPPAQDPLTLTYPLISVIVPVRNEQACIANTLQYLLDQNYPADRYEIIVADGRSTDDTRRIVESIGQRDGRVRLVDNPRQLSSSGRNAAIRAARGSFIVLVDGHCTLHDRDYLRHVAALFARTKAHSLARPQPLELANATPLQRAIAAARRSFAGHNPHSQIYSDRAGFVPAQSAAIAYRRVLFSEVGLFDENFDACEDAEFNHRLDQHGFLCWFAPELRVTYHPRTTLRGLAHQLRRYGTGRVRMMLKHPDTLTLAAVAPPVLFLTLAACLLLSPLTTLGWWLGVALLCAYGGFVAAGTVQVAWRGLDWRALVRVPAVFVTIHVGYAYGVVRELARQAVHRWTPWLLRLRTLCRPNKRQ